jgi:hypothetical protein
MVYWTFFYTSCNWKMVLTREINIIATSSAQLFSAVLYRAMACSGVHWHAVAWSGVHWHALACSGVLWRALACIGVHWRALACIGVHWRALAFIGVLWRALACTGMHWRALACSGVLWRVLACSGVLWRALLCRFQVLDNRTPLPDKRTEITWIILKNSIAVMCVFLKLFVHELLYKFFDSIDLKWCIGHWFTHPVIKTWF